MELEHVIGYNAKYHSTAAWHPGSPHIAAFGCVSLLAPRGLP